MIAEFVTYKTFGTREEVYALIEILKINGIEYQFEDNSPLDDVTSTYGSQVQCQFDVKIKPSDFEKADKILENEAGETVEKLPNDYYLYSFNEVELNEILNHFDQWNETDYQLAVKILKEKGENITYEIIRQKKAMRINQLKEPEKASQNWIILGYISAVLGGILGIFIGYYLSQFKKLIPTGEKVFAYDEPTQKSGKIIFFLGIVCVVIWTIIYLAVI